MPFIVLAFHITWWTTLMAEEDRIVPLAVDLLTFYMQFLPSAWYSTVDYAWGGVLHLLISPSCVWIICLCLVNTGQFY